FQLKKRVIQNEEVKNNRDIIYFCLDGNLTCRKKQQTITLEPDQTLFVKAGDTTSFVGTATILEITC
ncbi:MAG: hypothetical protein ACRDD4_08690, partial [Culicoidibacterales bacterium]